MEPRNQTWPFISFPLFLLFNLTLSSAADTLYAGHSLILNQTLISKGGNFELGFFNLGDSPNYYLGIWYKNVSILNRTYVWVANRDNPLHSKNSLKLKLSKGGNLDLFDNATYVVWSTNVIANSVNSPRAVLGDDGNLVLRYGENPFHVYWQSFDYPTDTVLAGARFGYDKITKKGQSQSSWKNENDPSQGLFSVELDPIAKQFNLLWNRSESYWSSGQWDGQIFTNIPTMKLAKNYNFSYVNNMNESYVTYNTSRVSRMVVNLSGQLVRYEWDEQTKRWFPLWSAPTQQCEVFGFCGAYGVCNENGLPLCKCMQGFQPRNKKEWDMSDFSSGGCVRKSSLECGARDGFFTITNVNLPLKQRSFAASNVDQCKSVCFNNCSCKAYAYRNSCLIWNEDLFGVQQFPGAYVGGGDFFLKLASVDIKKPVGTNSTVASKTSRGRNHTVKVAAIVGTVACLLIIALILGYLGLTKRQNKKGNISESEKQQLDLPLFDLCTIEAATNNFSISNKIGHGGFGPVYKGVLATGVEIAVKRLSKESRQGIKEFMNEVIVIAKLQHRNLVRLLGCCIDGAERMLIYEYMPNKSLDFIFDGTRNIELSWEKRCDIIIGIARGLLYLHQDSRLRIIHRDLKAANVLLDNEMNAKISDFGLARILGGDQNEQNTMSIVGTFGYMSPEYATDGLFSTKSDVYSFGVLVLEIISGQRNRGFHCSEHDLNLLGHAWKLLKDKTPLKLLDPSLVESLTMHEALKWIQVGLLCVQKFPEDRPTMETVLSMLESDGAKLPCPQEPGFYTERCPYENGASSSQGDGFTRNELTHTLLEGR